MSQKYKSRKLSELDDFLDNSFKKGTLHKHIDQLLETFTVDSIVMLFRIIKDEGTPQGIKLKAIQEILDRKLGKANQAINITGNVNHNHLIQGVIMLPQTTIPQNIIKLGSDGMPLLEDNTTIHSSEDIQEAEYVEEDSDVGKTPTQTND